MLKLNFGDTVALISSAYFSETISVHFGQERLEAMGFHVILGKSGQYPGYTVASIDGIATPMSKADAVTSNNLG